MANNLDTVIRRPKSFPFCGRLIVMETIASSRKSALDANLGVLGDLERNFSIDFPSMPESIELFRQAEYRVQTNLVLPDGNHFYWATHPLSIPFSFQLHYLDEVYCPEGALTIMKVAARLHSMILPFGDSTVSVTCGTAAPLENNTGNPKDNKPNPSAPTPGTEQQVTSDAQEPRLVFQQMPNVKVDPPATCLLELLYTEEEQPGIVCVGYLKDVKVVLKGPWLRGPNNAFNLPSIGEFGFNFVHHPGHGNFFQGQQQSQYAQQQAYADFVLQNFYRSNKLGRSGNYRGFNGPNATPTAPIPAGIIGRGGAPGNTARQSQGTPNTPIFVEPVT